MGLIDYVRLRAQAVEVDALRAEAVHNGSQLAELGSEVGGLAKELERLRELERKVRVIANLPGAMREARVPDQPAQGGGDELPDAEPAANEPPSEPGSQDADGGDGGGLGAVTLPDGHVDPAALARIQERAQHLAGQVPTRKLSLEDLLEGLEGQSQRLAATPSIWPTSGYVTSGFGNRISPFTGREQFHAGLDISADIGTIVIAPARGRVVMVGMNGPLGREVELDHGYGLRTVYGHLSAAFVKQGQTVERGVPIARGRQHRPQHGPPSPLRGRGERPHRGSDELHFRVVAARPMRVRCAATRLEGPMRNAILAVTSALLLATSFGLGGAAGAEEKPKLEKAGTVQILEYEAGIGINDVVWGHGTVEARGQTKKFRLNGMGVGGAGGAKISATGTVYNLTDIGLFPGVYSEADAGVVGGEKGKSTAIWLRNTNGVILELHGKQTGLAVTGGANGVVIQFED